MMYVIKVNSGKEFELRRELSKISGVEPILPTNMVDIRRGGVWHTEEKILIPGYMFLRCRYSPNLYYKVKALPGVTGWLGHGKPEALSESDEKFVGFFGNGGNPIPVLSFDSPFVKKAIIKRVDKHRRRITATIKVFDDVHTVTFGYRG